MLPLIPLAAAITSAAVLTYRNYRQKQQDARERLLMEFLNAKGVLVDVQGNFDPNAMHNDVPILFEAMNYIQVMTELLKRGANPNVCDTTGMPAIIHASTRSNAEELVELLLKYGANPNAMDAEGKTAIFHTLSNPVVRALQASGAEIKAVDAHGNSALFSSIKHGTTRTLVDLGTNANAKDSEGRTIAFYLPPEQFPLLQFLDEHGLDIEAVDIHGNKFKYYNDYKKLKDRNDINLELNNAVENNDIERARFALKQGADPNIKHKNVESWNMIHLAVYYNNPEMIRLLANAGGDINCSESALTPLKKAVYNNYVECFKTLLELGADPSTAEIAVKYSGTAEMKRIYKKYRPKADV